MKNLITITFALLFSFAGFCQISKVQECGLDEFATLNKAEASYFNEVFIDRRGDFDFNDKVIAYFTGSSGKVISSKSAYFHTVKRPQNNVDDVHAWQAESTQLVFLSDEEKAQAGGYDAILVFWSMIQVEGKRQAKLIKKLKEHPPVRE